MSDKGTVSASDSGLTQVENACLTDNRRVSPLATDTVPPACLLHFGGSRIPISLIIELEEFLGVANAYEILFRDYSRQVFPERRQPKY